MNEGKDHRLLPTARVEVGAELTQEDGLELTLEAGPELTLGAGLEIILEPIVKVTLLVTYGGVHPQSPNKPPPRNKVSFNDPKEEKDPAREDTGGLTEPSVGDLETWLEFQAGKLGTPAWWEELRAMLGIGNQCKFAQKIRASFYIPEVQMRTSPEQGYNHASSPPELEQECLPPRKTCLPGCVTASGIPNNSLCPEPPILGREA